MAFEAYQLIEPWTTWDAGTVFWWYLGAFIAAIVLSAIHKKLGLKSNALKDIPSSVLIILAGFIMPIAEELVFRGIPYLFGGGTIIMVAGTVVWTLLHGKRALIIAPFGVVFLKLWMSGFWVEAVVLHIVHNCFVVALYIAAKDVDDDLEDLTEDTKKTTHKRVTEREDGSVRVTTTVSTTSDD